MKELNPRIKCVDGVSLSVQANQYVYCSPRVDEIDTWNQYTCVEVGYITDANDTPLTPPDDWREYSDGSFPSDVYGYIPTKMVEAFIETHGGEISLPDAKNSETNSEPLAVGCSDLLALLHIQPRTGGHIVIEGHPDDEEEYLHMSEVKKIIKHLSSRGELTNTKKINQTLMVMYGYDDCIIGVVERFGQSPIVCYDKVKIIQKLESDGMDNEEAEEFFSFNQLGAGMGDLTPCFLSPTESDVTETDFGNMPQH